jgi:GTP-binding protein EngB required for normal cell division
MSVDLDRRLAALADAVGVADGRLDSEAVEAARRVTGKAGARLGLGVESTVVALAGPTGAGKSLLFNALTGVDLAAVGRRRPTTSVGQAAVWGDGADALLDWLEIGRRHRVETDGLRGLVLLDLPDFDSVETGHRLEVNRMVELADLLVWVVEPQKYADAALHGGYLRPLATHAGSMAVVLNQTDLLSPTETDAVRQDTARLLAQDGLVDAPVLAISARTGAGLDELRGLLARRVASREAALRRLSADVEAAAASLRRWCAPPRPTTVEERDRKTLATALSEAAGVPRVVEAVGAAHRHRGTLSSGWLPVRWVRRLKPDPLRRLRLDEGAQAGFGRTSLPPATDVQRAQVATALRAVADSASEGLPAPWPTLVRRAASAGEDRVADRLDLAVRSSRLDTAAPRWWRIASLLQWLLAATAVVGLAWIALAGIAGSFRIEDVVPLPDAAGVPVPTWLVLGGLGLGVVLSSLTRLVNSAGARRRQRAAERELRPAIESVAHELVVAPIEAELAAHDALRRALAVAAGDGS